MQRLNFGNAPRLAARLFSTCVQSGIPGAAIAVYRSNAAVLAAYPDDFGSNGVSLGCIWKGITATLVGTLVADRRVNLESEVGSYFSSTPYVADALAGIKLRDLLLHGHGLDDSVLRATPRLSNGRIDMEGLVAKLSTHPRIFSPGAAFHYGNSGSWISAALVEKSLDRLYTEALDERVLAAARSAGEFDSLRAEKHGLICPALGGSAEVLSAKQLLAIVMRHYLLPGPDNVAFLAERATRLPGETGGKEGAICGWYDYGAGWYGQNGIFAGHSALVRFNPKREIGIVITSASEQAFRILALCFSHLLPEFAQRQEYRSASRDSVFERSRLSDYVGTYANAAQTIRIDPGIRTPLRATIQASEAFDEKMPVNTFELRHTKENIFFCVPGDRNIPHLEFIRDDASNSFAHLWNGRQLWRRIARE